MYNVLDAYDVSKANIYLTNILFPCIKKYSTLCNYEFYLL